MTDQATDRDIKILIADDVFAARRITTRLLKALGYNNITAAERGKEAIDLCTENDYDIVIIDYNLGDMNAADVAAALQGGSIPPMLVATSDASREQLISAHEAGITDYMLKPFNKEVLQEKIENVLNKT